MDERFEKFVRDGEQAEPLGDGYYIIQSENEYRFGSDAVSLAHFAMRDISCRDKVLDLCSGCGIIGTMLAIQTKAQISAVEIDEHLCDMGVRSAELNRLKNITFTCCDALDTDAWHCGGFSVVVCNPPYYKANSKPSAVAPQANSEITITLDDVVKIARAALVQNGTLFMTHVTSRLDEVICTLRDNGFTVKKLAVNPNGKTFLLRAVSGGKPHMALEIKEY